MLIPIGIILYTVAGGLKATFISSYVHTVIIYVVLCLFSFMVYSPSSVPALGSPSKVSVLPCVYALCWCTCMHPAGALFTTNFGAHAILCLCACGVLRTARSLLHSFSHVAQTASKLKVTLHMATVWTQQPTLRQSRSTLS